MSSPEPTVDTSADDTPTRHTVTPSRTAIIAAVVAVLVACAAFAGGWLVGRPSYPGEGSPDAGFARDMQQHHAQAVEMSMIVRTAGVSNEVSTLAYDIARTQENQRGQMRGWLVTWGLPVARSGQAMDWMKGGHHDSGEQMLMSDGRMRGMASEAQMSKLRQAKGKAASILYLQLMTVHHRAGVTMAQACVAQCQDQDVVSLARTMVKGQQSEINLMTQMLHRLGGSVPADD